MSKNTSFISSLFDDNNQFFPNSEKKFDREFEKILKNFVHKILSRVPFFQKLI